MRGEKDDEDDALVLRILAGDGAALRRLLFERHPAEQIVRQILRGPHQADCVFEVAAAIRAAVHRKLKLYEPRAGLGAESGTFRGWLYQLSKNLTLTHLKRCPLCSGKSTRLDPRRHRVAALDPVRDPILRRRLCQLLMALTPYDRTIVVVHLFYGYELAELAEITGRNPATVRDRKREAFRYIRERLERRGHQARRESADRGDDIDALIEHVFQEFEANYPHARKRKPR
ncbi:MAG: hypothetical protein K8H88_01995 [Sandaracinaceae bacterium]|nr:hypothetical protein [Sandaracinaceae bacterium]